MASIRYLKVTQTDGTRYILRVTRESPGFIHGFEVDAEGDEVVPAGYDRRHRTIDRGLIKKTVEMRMNPKYTTLEVVPTSEQAKKTGAQLDADIAEALARPRTISTTTATKKIGGRQLDLLAQTASFGSLSVTDLVPQPRTIATITSARLMRMRRAAKQLREAAEAGMLVEVFGDKYELTDAGRDALEAAGFVQQSTGYWIKPGAKRPGWAA